MNDQVDSQSSPLPDLNAKPIDTDAVDDLLPLEDEYVLGEPPLRPRGIRVPRPLVWGVIILLVLAVVVAAVWGFAHSTWTYATANMDSAATARLAQLRDKLAAAGAPEAALRQVAFAAQPGLNVGDAIEALVLADKALEPVSDQAAIASARLELRAILSDLQARRYGPVGPSATLPPWTPLPSLAFPTP
jgi:hypothetical protein